MWGRRALGALGLEPPHELHVVARDPLERPRRRELEHEQPQLRARLAVDLGEPGALGRKHDLVVERLVGLRDRAP